MHKNERDFDTNKQKLCKNDDICNGSTKIDDKNTKRSRKCISVQSLSSMTLSEDTYSELSSPSLRAYKTKVKLECPKKRLLNNLLTRFYDKQYNITRLFEYICPDSTTTRIPIRIINWFVTNYSQPKGLILVTL